MNTKALVVKNVAWEENLNFHEGILVLTRTAHQSIRHPKCETLLRLTIPNTLKVPILFLSHFFQTKLQVFTEYIYAH